MGVRGVLDPLDSLDRLLAQRGATLQRILGIDALDIFGHRRLIGIGGLAIAKFAVGGRHGEQLARPCHSGYRAKEDQVGGSFDRLLAEAIWTLRPHPPWSEEDEQ